MDCTYSSGLVTENWQRTILFATQQQWKEADMIPVAANLVKAVVRKRQTTLEGGPKTIDALHPQPFDAQDQLQKEVM